MADAIILAGGRGGRIGGPKPLMELGGRALISYVLDAASEVSDEIVVVVGEEEGHLENLLPRKARIARDLTRGGGPLIGVYSGLTHLRSEYAVVLPCDSPFINTEVLKYLIGRAEGADAAVPLWPNGYIEPLHSVYNVPAALEAGKAAIEAEKLRVHSMIERLKETVYVPVEELRRFDPGLLTFFNINSGEDLKRAEAILRRRGLSR